MSAPAQASTTPAATAELGRLLERWSLEATPKQLRGLTERGRGLPASTTVYLPVLGSSRLDATVDAAAELVRQGHRPVPHLAARRLASRSALDDMLTRYREVGVDSLLLVAGDVDAPAGPFSSTLDVLETGALQRHGFGRLGVAGHPGGHPKADAASLDRALATKAAYARETASELWVVTQFVFEWPEARAWGRRLRDEGLDLPLRLGVAGPAGLAAVMRYALLCGVGASARVMARRPDAARLLGRWSPDALVQDLAADQSATTGSPFSGLHVFAFGGLEAALDWRTGLMKTASEGKPA